MSKKTRYRTSPAYARQHGCPHVTIDAAMLDAEVWALVEGIIKHPDRIVEQITQSFTAPDPTQAERASIEGRLRKVKHGQSMQAQVISQLGDIEAAAPNIKELRRLGQERKEHEAALAALEQRRQGWANGLAAAERLLAMFEAEQARLNSLTYADKRHTLEMLGVTVTLYPVGSEPRWTMTTNMPLPELVEDLPDDGREPASIHPKALAAPASVYSTSTDFEPTEYYPAMAEAIAKAESFTNTASARDARYPEGPPGVAPGPVPPSRPRPGSRDRPAT